MSQRLIRREAAQFMQDYLLSIGEADFLFSEQENQLSFAQILDRFEARFSQDERTVGTFSDHLQASLTSDPARFSNLRRELEVPIRTPLNQVVSLVEALIASDEPGATDIYEQFFHWNAIQETLRDTTRFSNQMEDRRLHHFIQNQAADEYRSIVETVSNAIDFSEFGGTVDVHISKHGYVVRDYGMGMNSADLFEKLLIPYASGARAVDRAAIGKFGLGFYTVFSHLQHDGDSVVVKTCHGDKCYQLSFLYQRGEIYLIPSLNTDIQRGTEIIVHSDSFDPKSAEKSLIDHVRYKRNATVNLHREYDHSDHTDISETEIVNTHDRLCVLTHTHSDIEESAILYQCGEKSKNSGSVSFLINGIMVESHKFEGQNIPQELALDFPYTATLPEARNEVRFDATIARSFLELISEIVRSSETAQTKVQLLNGIAESIQIFAKRFGSDPRLVQNLFSEIQTQVNQLCASEGLYMVPDIPGIENLQFEMPVAHISVVIAGLSLVDVPGISRVANFSSASLVLYTAPFKEGSKNPSVFHKNVIILDRKIYEKHKDHPTFLNTYLREIARMHEYYDESKVTSETHELETQDNYEYPVFLEKPVPEQLMQRLTELIPTEYFFKFLAYPDQHSLNSGLISRILTNDRDRKWISQNFQKVIASFLLGKDEGNLTGLLQNEISIHGFINNNVLDADRDEPHIQTFLQYGVANLKAHQEMVLHLYAYMMDITQEVSSDSILEWYKQYIQKIQEADYFQEFSEETRKLLLSATSPYSLWKSGENLIEKRINQLKYKSNSSVRELLFLYILNDRFTDVIDLYEHQQVIEENQDIQHIITQLYSIDWYADPVSYKRSQLGAYTSGLVTIIRKIENPEEFIENTVLPLLEQFPFMSRLAVFEMLFAVADPDAFARMNLRAKYNAWTAFYKNRNQESYSMDSPRSFYAERAQAFSDNGLEVLQNLRESIPRIMNLPNVMQVIDQNQALAYKMVLSNALGKPVREYGGEEFKQIAPSRNVLNDHVPYLSRLGEQQLEQLNTKIGDLFDPREMTKEKMDHFYFILQSSLRFAHMDVEKFSFAIDLLCADTDYCPGLDVEKAIMQPYLFSESIFEVLFEKRWIFSIVSLDSFVIFWKTIQKESSSGVLPITQIHLHRLLTIFEALAYKSQQQREELLTSMQTASIYSRSDSFDFFRLQHIEMSKVPVEIRPYVIYFRNNEKKNGSSADLFQNRELAQTASLTKMALAKRLHFKQYLAAVENETVNEFIFSVTENKNAVVTRRELIHAVNHLPTNDPYLFLRELLQNVIDAVDSDGTNRAISVKDFYFGDHFVVEVNDPVGMPPETALADLIVPGSSSKEDSELGQFGIGFLSVLKDAQKVEIVTDDGTTRTEIELLPVYSDAGELNDFIVSYSFGKSQGQGTTIRKYMHFSDGAIESAFIEDAVYRYSRFVDSKKAQIHHNEKQVNTQQTVLASVEHEVLGVTQVFMASESALLQGSLYVSDLPDYLRDLIPIPLQDFYEKFGLVLDLGKNVELLRTRNDIARKQMYIQYFKEVIPELFVKSIIQRYVSGSFDLSLIPYDFYWSDGSAGNTGWSIETWIEKDSEKITTGTGAVDYSKYLTESHILQLLVSIKQFTIKGKEYSLREIVTLVNSGELTDFTGLPNVVTKKLEESRERQSRIRFHRMTTKDEHKILSIPETEKLREVSPAHAAFLWLVLQLTPARIREGVSVEYYHLPDESIAHARYWMNTKGWNLHREYFGYDIRRLSEFIESGEWSRDFDSFLRSLFTSSSHEDTHLDQGSTCDTTRRVDWTGSHNSIFTQQQIDIMGEVLYDVDIDGIKQGLKQFGSDYLERWELLQELGLIRA